MDAFDLLEDIRVSANGAGLAAALGSMETTDDAAAMSGAIISLLPKVVSKHALEQIRHKLFRHVEFQIGSDSPAWIIGSINEEARAFEKCGAIAVYKVLIKALLVNFTDTFSELLSPLQEQQD